MTQSQHLRAVLLALPVGVSLAVLPFTASAQGAPGGAPPPAKVVVQPAEIRTIALRIEVPGTVHSRQDAEIAAEVAGRVTWVAEAGTRVAAGEPVARLDDRVLVLEQQGLAAQIESLKSQLEFQTREVARLTELAARGSAPQSRLEEGTSRRDVLAHDLVQARVRHDRIALDLERTVVRAPFAGQIAARMIEVGEFSNPGADVVRLVAVDDVEVRVQAPVAIAPHLREGMAVALGDGSMGHISRLIPVGEERSRTFEVRVALPAAQGDAPWIVGGAVTVALPAAAAQQVTAVPRDALVLRGNGTFVFRVKPDGTAERLAVQVGTSDGPWVQVTGGISAGDSLVIRGAERLREGQAVETGPRVS
ncbi:MAG: hypothetical protein RLY86_2695 [Pseudomonadota bacterium]